MAARHRTPVRGGHGGVSGGWWPVKMGVGPAACRPITIESGGGLVKIPARALPSLGNLVDS